MKIEVNEYGPNMLVLKEVFNGAILETEEGNRVVFCMRDDTIEISVMGSDKWYRADIEDGSFYEL